MDYNNHHSYTQDIKGILIPHGLQQSPQLYWGHQGYSNTTWITTITTATLLKSRVIIIINMTHTTETYNKQIKQVLKQLPSYRSLLTMFRPFLLAISMTGVRVILDKDAWPNFDWQYLTGVRVILVDEAWPHFCWQYLWLAPEWSSLTKLGPISVGNIYDWCQSDPRWRSSAPFLLAISMTASVILVDDVWSISVGNIYDWYQSDPRWRSLVPFLLTLSMTECDPCWWCLVHFF